MYDLEKFLKKNRFKNEVVVKDQICKNSFDEKDVIDMIDLKNSQLNSISKPSNIFGILVLISIFFNVVLAVYVEDMQSVRDLKNDIFSLQKVEDKEEKEVIKKEIEEINKKANNNDKVITTEIGKGSGALILVTCLSILLYLVSYICFYYNKKSCLHEIMILYQIKNHPKDEINELQDEENMGDKLVMNNEIVVLMEKNDLISLDCKIENNKFKTIINKFYRSKKIKNDDNYFKSKVYFEQIDSKMKFDLYYIDYKSNLENEIKFKNSYLDIARIILFTLYLSILKNMDINNYIRTSLIFVLIFVVITSYINNRTNKINKQIDILNYVKKIIEDKNLLH